MLVFYAINLYSHRMEEIKLFKKRIFAFLPAFLLFFLAGCGGDDALIAYQFQGNAVPALDKVLTAETGGTYVTSLSPAEGGGEMTEPVPEEEESEEGSSSEAEETSSTEPVAAINYISYDYQMFIKDKASEAVKAYVDMMTKEEYAFELDSEEEPDYSTSVGTVILKRAAVLLDENGEPTEVPLSAEEQEKAAEEEEKKKAEEEAQKEAEKEAEKNMTKEEKKAAKEKKKAEEEAQKQLEKELEVLPPYSGFAHDSENDLIVEVHWTPTSCLVTLTIEGVPQAGEDGQPSSVISYAGAKTLMYSIVPAELGLPGEDMSEYTLKPGPGYVMVDDVPCLTVYVYKKTDEHTNELATTCFISADGSTLYQQEKPGDNQVKKVQLGDIPDPLPTDGEELLEMAVEADK